VLDRFSTHDWRLIMSAAGYQTLLKWQTEEQLPSKETDMPLSMSPRLACFLMTRLNSDAECTVWQLYLQDYEGDDLEVLRASMQVATQRAEKAPEEWVKALSIISYGYKHGAIYPWHFEEARVLDHALASRYQDILR